MTVTMKDDNLQELERVIVEAVVGYDAADKRAHGALCPPDCTRCAVVRALSKGSRRLIENARTTMVASAMYIDDTTCGKLLFIAKSGTSPTCVLTAGHEGPCSSTKRG